jgi:peptidoglycan/LPS O-acetylase OafA/YrhL
MMTEKDRLDWVDGLRGIAVALVVLDHTWQRVPGALPSSGIGAVILAGGLQGVSLFLVLSGFCLSWAHWRGKPFTPSAFFSGRILRILPPYYVALLLVIVLDRALPLSRAVWSSDPASKTDIAEHVLLIHNLTPNVLGLNGPFWSLGLEWQWYLLFPLVFVASIRRPWVTLVSLVALSVVWTPLAQSHFIWYAATLLPGRLFEFAAGIAVARVVAQGAPVRSWLLMVAAAAGAALVALTLLGTTAALTTLQVLGLYWPLVGALFAALVLAGRQRPTFRHLLASRPLSGLGRISYSVYLIHFPVIGMMGGLMSILHAPGLVAGFVLAGSGVVAGAGFYWCVERPVMSRRARAAVLPGLERRLRWCDRWWAGGSSETAPEIAVASAG